MKFNALYLTSALILGCCVAQVRGQTDSIWFQPGCKWVHHFLSFGGPGEVYLAYQGQDMVGGRTCIKLAYYGYTQPDHQLPPHFESWGDRFAYSQNDSVFLWHEDQWVLIYDFTLGPGDTMALSFATEFSSALIEETGTDTILNIPVRFQKWKKKHIADSIFDYHLTVYDRLGGEFILEDALDLGSPAHEGNYFLTCFRDDIFSELECSDLPVLNYVHFPISPASWSEEESAWCSTTGYRFLQSGNEPYDTLVWGVGVGKKLYIQLTYLLQDACPDPSSENFQTPPVLIGLLDQNYSSKEVYFTRLSDSYQNFPVCISSFDDVFPLNESVLLYDFNLNVGDIIPWKSEPNVVLYVDSVQLADETFWRKRYYFGFPPEGDLWIEGMGSVKGLLSPYYNYNITDVTCGTLHCYTNEQLLYQTVEAWMCDSILSTIVEVKPPSEMAVVYPNPAYNEISFSISGYENEREINCSIYNYLGQEVLRSQVDLSADLDYIVDIYTIPHGLYRFVLSNEHNNQLANGVFAKQ